MGFTVVPDRAAGYAVAETDWDASIKDNFNTGTIVRLGDVTLAGVGTFTFSSIPSTYAHLMVVCYLRATDAASANTAIVRFNSDSGANYDTQRNNGFAANFLGAEFFALSGANIGDVPSSLATANIFGGLMFRIPHYANTTRNKALTSRYAHKISGTSTGVAVGSTGSQWRSNAAITSLEVRALIGPNFAAGSRATLYAMA